MYIFLFAVAGLQFYRILNSFRCVESAACEARRFAAIGDRSSLFVNNPGWEPRLTPEFDYPEVPGLSKVFTNYSAFRRSLISVYAVSISFVRAVASTSCSGLSFT